MLKAQKQKKGFTLIELLIVIAILGIIGLTAVTQFQGSEQEAKESVSSYNKKITQDTTNKFYALYGVYPSGWHTGFDLTVAPTKSVEGLAVNVAINMALDGGGAVPAGGIANNYTKGFQVTTPGVNVKALTLDQSRALREYGIHQLASGGYMPVSTPASVSSKTDLSAAMEAWVLTGGTELLKGGSASSTFPTTYTVGTTPVTINGRALSTYQFGSEAVVLVFCTRDVAWTTVLKGDPDTTGYGEYVKPSKIRLDEAPRDSLAIEDSAFPYYIAAFYLSPFQIGSKAGFSCRLLGVLDADLNPIAK